MRSKLITAYIAVRSMSNISDIALEIVKNDGNDGVDKKDVLRLFMSAILCGSDAFLTDMLGISVDDMLDKTCAQNLRQEKGLTHGTKEV